MKMHNCWPCSELMVVKPMDQSPTGTHQPFFTVHCRPIYKYVPVSGLCWKRSWILCNTVTSRWWVVCVMVIYERDRTMLPYHFWKYIVEKDISFYVAPLKSLLFRAGRALESYFQRILEKKSKQICIFTFYKYLEFVRHKYVILYSVSHRIVCEYIFILHWEFLLWNQ